MAVYVLMTDDGISHKFTSNSFESATDFAIYMTKPGQAYESEFWKMTKLENFKEYKFNPHKKEWEKISESIGIIHSKKNKTTNKRKIR